MSLLRAFIAIEIPPEIQASIASQTAPMRAALDSSLVRWVPTHNLHLTLKFLGDVSPANVEMISQMLAVEASQQPAFEMGFANLGAFPDARHPRVLWIGIQAPAELEALSYGIEAASARLGYPGEKRPFSPHLTIGRVKQNVQGAKLQPIRDALETTRIGQLGSTKIMDVRLFKSVLESTGAVYTQLFSAPLQT